MRVLLVNTNTFRFMSPMPLGLAFLASSLRKRQHQVAITDLMFAAHPRAQLRRAMAAFKPDFVGFTIRNLDNQDMGNPVSRLAEIRGFVGLAKEAGLPSVVGGTAFTTLPKTMLTYMDADYGIAGQGEVGLPRLIESHAAGGFDIKIPGLVWRQDGVVKANPPGITGYQGVSGAWDVLNMKGYRSSMMPAAVLVKTGCPYKCSYCDAFTTFGGRFYIRDPEEIVDNIASMRRIHRVATFFLVDPCLNAPLPQAKEILEALVRADLKVNISSMLVPLRGEYDREFLQLYRRAGGRFAMLGVESFSDTMLESYQKPFDMHDVHKLAAMARSQGIRFGVNLLFGGPGETAATMDETFAAMGKIPFSFIQSGLGVRVLPDTAVFRTAIEEGLLSTPEELFEPTFYLSAPLDHGRAAERINRATRRYSYRALGMAPVGISSAIARYLNIAI